MPAPSMQAHRVSGRSARPLLPPRTARHRLPAVCPARAQASPGAAGGQPNSSAPEQQEQVSVTTLALKAVVLACAANAMVACLPAEAQAGTGSWRVRRHRQSRIREQHANEETPKQAAARRATQKQQQQAAAAAAAARSAQVAPTSWDLQRLVQAAQRRVQRALGGDEVYSVGVSANRQQVYGSGGPPAASPFGWLALAAAGAALLALLFGGRLQLPWGGRRGGKGGRWVRDRSLGGKMIFIPDAELTPGKAPRPLWEELGGEDDMGSVQSSVAAGNGGGEAGPWSTAGSGASAAAAAAAAAQRGREPELPSWWRSPNFLVYAPFSRKEELQRQARMALRQLEDAKLLQGADFSLSGLVTLRTLCQEAGGYQVKSRTESGRDAMLRAGVRAAISAAQEGRFALLGGDHPAKFVCGLAHDLGVPDTRAVTIVHAEVAAVCRAALIEAEAAFRASSQSDILVALIKIAGTLQAFPLPAGSAEAELVAAGVVKQTSLEFRKAILMEFGSVSTDLAALVAELLGFNPDLVMPFLEQQQQAAAAAQASAEAAAQAAQIIDAGQPVQQQQQQQGEAQ